MFIGSMALAAQIQRVHCARHNEERSVPGVRHQYHPLRMRGLVTSRRNESPLIFRSRHNSSNPRKATHRQISGLDTQTLVWQSVLMRVSLLPLWHNLYRRPLRRRARRGAKKAACAGPSVVALSGRLRSPVVGERATRSHMIALGIFSQHQDPRYSRIRTPSLLA